ncbi:DPP IV N-terminal domain-containing protein [Fluviicola sp.]|uniref:S9 family peptidase n=1 Tax=Fluviicola sp. TaxID=1917219 RepID=UPI00262CC85F|nr:DPP IV N-terminal domain-containing protein [Fluviicola sp.]
MNKYFGLFVCLIAGTFSFAQKKQLTLSDAVLQQNRAFRDEQFNAFTWIPGTDSYVYLSNNYQVMYQGSVKKTEPEQILTIQAANTALGAQLYSFYGFSFRNADELLLTDGNNYYNLNLKTKTGSKLASVPEEGANAEFETTSGSAAYTVENNLWIVDSKGEKIAVTKNTDKNIVSGQTYARSEFGITDGIFWSGKGGYLAFYQKDETNVKEYPLVDITKVPAELMNIKYPMAGQGSEQPKVGIYSVSDGKTVFITPKGAKDSYLTNLSWTPDENFVLVAEVNREQNHMWLNQYEAKTGNFIRTILEEQNDKWTEPEHPAFFPLTNSNNFIWISERDGFNNLYYYSIDGKLIKQLTANKFVTKEILQSINKGKEVVFAATGTSALNTLYYAVDMNGKQRCLTLEEGTHSIAINEMGTYFLDSYSSHAVPGKVELKTIAGKITKTLLTAKNKLAEIAIGASDIGKIKADDGSVLYTRLIKPSNFDPNKKYPVMVYVYGGPHAQMITNSWLDGANLWMYWMAEQGYLVFTLDNRGSGERGFAFESQIHRQLGTVEIKDQMKGIDYLKSLAYVDSSRFAVHGWSFGGFMTTSLMLKQAETFKVGVAGGPVTDWKYYEIMYGERYMDRPEENQKGYEEASLFTHANKLKGDLLLIHGTVDDVVVPQHNDALLKRFIELGIQIDFFHYPMHKHNVIGKDRVHLMQKVLDYIIEHNK